jgi:sigma-B regulation protein RsbU (phosphoserine phosphatase)
VIEGPPAGWFEDATFGETEVELEPGASLVMYTDGLIEARQHGQLLGIDAVRSALEDAAGSAEETIGALRDLITAPEVTVGDDVAVLTLRAGLDD